ncbi:hypothetical protein H2198_004299 [Neophaeococcomyces mojaviensis]|uniref:Uncharacterized protein n=1 Tax=Neophaeococcomyces mojaviensis TaxID=3383035 RepID=A0ACC3A9C2_9EURO|nr:hypothetical protein H2198_004299 [Knufia sp. JES_112]
MAGGGSSQSRGRKPFKDVFDDLQIGLGDHARVISTVGASTCARSSSPLEGPRTLENTLSHSIKRNGFPCWTTLQWNSSQPTSQLTFSLEMNENTRSYKPGQAIPSKEFLEAVALIEELKDILPGDNINQSGLESIYTSFMHQTMCEFVFGSNMIEGAGLDLNTTICLCNEVFNGQIVDAACVDSHHKFYNEMLLFLQRHRNIEKVSPSETLKLLREVIQHAQALKHITDATLLRNEPLTENLILETHRILCASIPRTGRTHEDYAGKYRTEWVYAGTTQFPDPKNIPALMAKFVEVFNQDVKSSESSGKLDPFFLAADACQDLVTIHPFADGNGRMCRLLMNMYLIKYAGIIVNLGEQEQDRGEYMTIAARAGDGDTEEEARGELARMVLERGANTLRRLKTRLSAVQLEKLEVKQVE